MKENGGIVSNHLQSGALGILGGTFDPVHLGHMQMAKAALNCFGLERVILLVSADPPHKRAAASVTERLEMAEIALDGEDKLELSSLEAKRPGRTYTIESLEALKRLYPDKRLMYIIGSDTLGDLPTWKRASDVAKLCEFIVFHRTGGEKDSSKVLAVLPELKLNFAQLDILDVSSTRIRAFVKNGESLSGLVCPGVEAYIRNNGLYA